MPSTTSTFDLASNLSIDSVLLESIVNGAREGLAMTGLTPPAVGAGKLCQSTRPISVIVGLVGKSNGTLTLNMSERAMLLLASRLLMEEQTETSEDVYDAISEVGNMVAGCVKELLANSEYELRNISVPSVILGMNYNVYYTRGVHTLSVDFELEDLAGTVQSDRFFSVTVSLLRQIA